METDLATWIFTVQKYLIVVGHGTVLQRARHPVLRYPHNQTGFPSTRPGMLNGLTVYMQQFRLPSLSTNPTLYNQKTLLNGDAVLLSSELSLRTALAVLSVSEVWSNSDKFLLL